jgi:hypothetical protein
MMEELKMKKTINSWDFVDAFSNHGRQDSFSYEGKHALFDYFEELENDTGVETELDVIAICCEYTEYSNITEFQEDYGTRYETIEDIENETQVIKINEEAFIIQQF